MRTVLHAILSLVLAVAFPQVALAGGPSKGKHKGPEVSTEHKSEEGLEHGKAYAGTRGEEEEEEATSTETEEGKAKKEKKEKKEKKSKEY
jgi:hypothetical protein